MSTETIEAPATDEAPATEMTEPEAPKPAPSAEVAIRTQPAAMAMSSKMKYAEMLAKSGLLPKDYRYNPANVLFGVEYGQMLGLQPMAAITGIHIIDGRPTASAALITALVRRAGHKLRVGYDAAKMTGWAEVVRSDDPDYTFRSEWDLDRAVIAELCTIREGKPYAVDSKGKSLPWRKFFPSMTKARAITEVVRDACEEVLFGLHYTPEELGGGIEGEGSVITGEIVSDPWTEPVVETDQAWLNSVHERAAGVGEDNYAALWKQAVDGCQAGKCTAAELKHAQDMITARMENVRKKPATPVGDVADDAEVVDAEIVDESGLEPEDDWATAVDSIADAEDGESAKADLAVSLKNGTITSDRYQQVLGAIDARLASLGQRAAA